MNLPPPRPPRGPTRPPGDRPAGHRGSAQRPEGARSRSAVPRPAGGKDEERPRADRAASGKSGAGRPPARTPRRDSAEAPDRLLSKREARSRGWTGAEGRSERSAAPGPGKGTEKRPPRKAAASRGPSNRAPQHSPEAEARAPARRGAQRLTRSEPRASAPEPPPRKQEPQRIAKLLARAGIASRREIERMIEEGRVALGGKPVETPATILTSLHGVTVDGQPVRAAEPARLFRYHKPVGLLTTERDPRGRPTIYDRLPAGLPRVMPVGRLDLNTEGLLLLTTDGELKRQLELPSSKVERVYRARAFGEVSQEQLEELITGVEIEGVRYGSIDANLERRTGRNAWIEMRLTEGKNREVRRVLEYLGLQVSRLIRVAYGPLVLGDLPAGGVDEVRQHDLVEFRKGLR